MRVEDSEVIPNPSRVTFSETWDVLGPFQIGTREATWGADPLEFHGGFGVLDPNLPDHASFPSSLGWQGKVSWSKLTAQPISPTYVGEVNNQGVTSGSDAVKLTTRFPEIDWKALQEVYGWAALQWQAWNRGILTVHGSEAVTVKIYTPAVLEFEIDGERHFGGDFFSYMHAPLILRLDPGDHVVNIRVIRDLRAFGGVGEPVVELMIHAIPTIPGLVLDRSKVLIPDMVKGFGVTSTICGITAQNTGSRWLDIVSVNRENANGNGELFLLDEPVSLAPGQTKAITIGLKFSDPCKDTTTTSSFSYMWRDSDELLNTDAFLLRPEKREPFEPLRMVFRRSNGTVSYALLQAPSSANAGRVGKTNTLPILVVLHGAGVEAESEQSREMLKAMGDIPAWVLIPTGSTRWSGDDWHTWGLADVEAAITAIPECIENIRWEGPKADIQNLYIAGHSNGGQGTWHMLTHLPDRIRAAAAVSGYLSIQKYVPYSIWNEVDPKISGILHASLSSYRHELLIENTKGIPIVQQHGDKDDNVPTFHSRRMFQLLHEVGSGPDYHELPGKFHWDNGTMATPALKSFYSRIAQPSDGHYQVPRHFSIIIPSTGEQIGSRMGIVVDQLEALGQLGCIDVEVRSSGEWDFNLSNIARFHIGSKDYQGPCPTSIRINSQVFEVGHVSPADIHDFSFERNSNWTYMRGLAWKSLSERSGPQYGTINAVLRTKSQLRIRYQPELFNVALQVSRNIYQYYLANCDLVPINQETKTDGYNQETKTDGNEIVIRVGSPDVPRGETAIPVLPDYPIKVNDRGIAIHTSNSGRLYFNESGLGAIFLVPRTGERLQLVIWGHDYSGALQAARLIPGLTGVSQPDFVIVRKECSWRGAGGVLAMGFLEHDWTISASAYIL